MGDEKRLLDFGVKPITIIQSLIFAGLVGMLLARNRIDPRCSAAALLFAIGAMIVVGIGNYGLLAIAHVAVPFVTILSSIVFGRQVARWLFLISTAHAWRSWEIGNQKLERTATVGIGGIQRILFESYVRALEVAFLIAKAQAGDVGASAIRNVDPHQ